MTASSPPQAGSPGSDGVVPEVRVSFWLLPSAADEQWLQEVVIDLARRHGGPVFAPHVTLHSATCARTTDMEALLRKLAAKCPALNLEALGTAESDVYYRTLFIDMSMDRLDGQRMLGLRRELVLALHDAHKADAQPSGGGASDEAAQELEKALSSDGFRPHLSLLYADMAQPGRAALAQQNDFRGRSIVFDRVAAVRPAPGYADMSKVSHWEVFGHQTLSG